MSRATRYAAVLAVVLGAGLVSGSRADDAKVNGDLKKMQGTWVRAGNDGPDVKWVIDGESLKATVNGMEFVCTFTIDPKATPNPTADLAIKEGPGDAAGKNSKAIYKFDGDKLIFCVTSPGIDTRPAEFKAIENETHLFELKKES